MNKILEKLIIVGFLLLFVMTSAALADDWPQAAANPARNSHVGDEPVPTYTKAWTKSWGDECLFNIQPIIIGGKVYIGTLNGKVHAVNAETGSDIWTADTNSVIVNTLAGDSSYIYVASMDGYVRAINRTSGSFSWQEKIGSKGFSASPLLMGGNIYIGCRDGYFYAVDASDGDTLWSTNTGAPIAQTAAGSLSDNKVVFTNELMDVYCLNTSTGSSAWSSAVNIAGGFVSPWWPVIHQGKVVIRTQVGSTMAVTHLPYDLQDRLVPAADSVSQIVAESSDMRDFFDDYPEAQTTHVLNLSDGSAPYTAGIYAETANTGCSPPPAMAGDGNLYFPFRTSAAYNDEGVINITRCMVGRFNISTGLLATPLVTRHTSVQGSSGTSDIMNIPTAPWELTSDETVTLTSGGNLIFGTRNSANPGVISLNGSIKTALPGVDLPRAHDMQDPPQHLAISEKYICWVKFHNVICVHASSYGQDTTAPTPDPMTWATQPYSTGSTSISMTATTASDASGVEYFFDCTAGGGHDSGWQDGTTYEDTGLTPSTQYTYRVQARDKSTNQNTTAWSTSQSATTDSGSDTTPPTPNPLTWATVPYSTGTTSISMTATTASDPSGVEYFFDCTAGGGNDSGWQDSTTYQDTGLSPSTQYTYRVQARDKSANQNAGGWSTSESATTDSQPDTTPPTPNPLTWASEPTATGSTSISMTATTASDPSGVEYYFDCTAGGGNDSGWQDSTSYEDTGLDPNTQYTYRVQARDKSANQNTGGWSSSESATTNSAGSAPSDYEAYWKLDETSGTTAYDESSNSWDGILTNGATWYSGGKVNGCVQFDNINDNVTVSSFVADFDYVSICCWYNPDDVNAVHDLLVQLPGGVAELRKAWMEQLQFKVKIGSTVYSAMAGDSGITADTWTHVAGTFDGTTLRLYMNGTQVASTTQSGTMASSTGNLRMGWTNNSTIDGLLDEVYVYTRALSAQEVNSVMNAAGGTPDTTAPTPDPLTWSTVPYATGSTSISMTATTASDPSGVEYYFDCTAGGGNDSGWQDSTTYEDTGLSPSTQYTYRVQARDKSANQNAGGWSTSQSATTDAPPDTTAPTPNPLTWATVPYATGSTSISMTATTASDPSGVEYFFDCTAGGGNDSGWQDSTTYEDTGLSPSTQYTYRVQARDKSANQNTGGWSTSESATTDAQPDTTPPTPDPLTWSSVPAATGSSSIEMTATTASDPSGVEYYFDCTAGGGNDSGWQDSTTYEDTGLSPSTQYTYRVQARDKSANQNTGGWSTSESAATDAPPDTTAPTPNPMTWSSVPAATGSTSISMTATTASDPSGVEYFFDCTAGGGNDSGWQDSTTYEDTGLDPNTQYTYRVQARDKSANQNETAWSTTESATTDAESASVPVFGNEQFYSPWYGTTGTGNIPFDVNTCPDTNSTVSAWAERTNAGWTEIRASGDEDIGDREFFEFDCYWDTDTQPGTTIGAFHMQVNDDDGWTFKWEGSSVCWIDANQQTFSPNPTFSGKTWQHFKLDLDTNVQGGTWPSDPNIGVIRIYFANANGSSMYINNAEFTGGSSAPDTNPPTPNPLTWATEPYATGSTSISMTATTASDPSGVEYFFDCTAGGGNDSGWQDGTTYEDTGLSPSTQYTYRVQARDKSANQNAGGWSTAESATTDAAPDTTPPTPNPLTWSSVPYATGSTSISTTATTASDPSGVEYFFDCTAGGGNDSGWQDSTTYEDTGLSPSTQYTYRVQARDKSANQNAGGWSTAESATTDAPPDTTPPTPDPLTWSSVPASTGTTSISMTATTASDPSGVEYYFDCTAGGGNDSGWQDSTTYEDSGLDPNTQYTYRVQARDKSANQNTGGWSTAESATTDSSGSAPTDYEAYWKLDETSGTTAYDESSNSWDGVLTNGASWYSGGIVNGCVQFDNTNDHVNVSNFVADFNNITICCWYKPDDIAADHDVLVKVFNAAELRKAWMEQLQFKVTIGSTSYDATVGSSGIEADTWTHVAGTYDGTTLRLYMNGTQVASTTQSGAMDNTTGSLRMGWTNNATINGLIDEVYIYPRALSTQEVNDVMDAGQ